MLIRDLSQLHDPCSRLHVADGGHTNAKQFCCWVAKPRTLSTPRPWGTWICTHIQVDPISWQVMIQLACLTPKLCWRIWRTKASLVHVNAGVEWLVVALSEA